MNLLTRLFTPQAPEQKSTPLIALQLLATGKNRVPRDYASLAREGVMQNAIVYRCVRTIAESAASVPFLLYDGAKELGTHPLLTLLGKPNPDDSGTELFERWYAFLQSAGNAYLEAVSLRGEVRELHVLRPDRMDALVYALTELLPPNRRGEPKVRTL